MLKIHVLNVGHGDSLVVEFTEGSEPVFGIIDSNHVGPAEESPVLKFLRSRKASWISFLMLTHPHADHFKGLGAVLKEFPVRTFCSYPMQMDFKRMKVAGLRYLDAASQSNSPTVKQAAMEFVSLIIELQKQVTAGSLSWLDLEGATKRFRPDGFAGVTINAVLPLKKIKGEYYNLLDMGRPEAIESPKQNELSVAVDIEYAGQRVGLCGDAPTRSWMDHQRELERSNERLRFSIAKLPHHGSAADCGEKVIDYLFDAANSHQKIALISADGSKHHPAAAVLKSLQDRNIKPYCTNLSTVCGNNIRALLTSPTISPEILNFLNVFGITQVPARRQACQGNICVAIAATGATQVHREFNHPCAFRGDFDSLGLA